MKERIATSTYKRVFCSNSDHTHPYEWRYVAALFNRDEWSEAHDFEAVCSHNHWSHSAATNCAVRYCKRNGLTVRSVDELEPW